MGVMMLGTDGALGQTKLEYEEGTQDQIRGLIFTSCCKNSQRVNDFQWFYFTRGKTEMGICFQI